MSNPSPKKGVSALDFFCIGFGAIVGVGWAVSVNNWMIVCGGPVPAAIGYLVVLIMMIPIGLCYAELVPMLPVAGGGMAFAFKAFNEKVAMLSGWASLGAMISFCPWEAIQITDVLAYLFPGIKSGPILYQVMGYDIYLVVIVIGAVLSFLLFALNMKGLAAAAVVQKILCLVLVLAAAAGAIAAFAGGSPANWQPLYDVSDPTIYGPELTQVSHGSMFGGMFAIVTQAAFFLAGFETIPQGVEEAGGDIRTVGKTVVLSVLIACLFYAILLFAYGYAMPWQEFAHVTRPAASTLFLTMYPGTVGKVLYWALTIGAMAGLLTSWNGFFAASGNLLMGMGRGKLIPAFLAKQNERGIASNGMIVCLILSLAGPFLGASLVDTITSFSAVAFELSWCLTAWSLVSLRRRYPDMERPYKIPGGMAMGLFASIVSSIVVIASFFPASPFYIGTLAIKIFAAWILIGVVFFLLSGGQRKKLSEAELEAGVFGTVAEKQ